MSRLRHHPIVRVAVLVLLAWTAIDLLAPELCSAESENAASTASAASLTNSGVSVLASPASDRQTPADTPTAPDDCFCCSHCVDPVTLSLVLGDGAPVTMTEARPEHTSPGVVRPLFRPPLSL